MSKAMIFQLLLLALVYQLSNQHQTFVRADERLIQLECHNADVPEVCMQCLNSDPHSKNADGVGIAEIIVGCLRNHVHILLETMKNIASSTQDKGFKTALQHCEKTLLSADSDLSGASSKLKDGRYDDAEHLVSEAVAYEVSCDDIFGRYERHLPLEIAYERKIYEELSEAANRIIERL